MPPLKLSTKTYRIGLPDWMKRSEGWEFSLVMAERFAMGACGPRLVRQMSIPSTVKAALYGLYQAPVNTRREPVLAFEMPVQVTLVGGCRNHAQKGGCILVFRMRAADAHELCVRSLSVKLPDFGIG